MDDLQIIWTLEMGHQEPPIDYRLIGLFSSPEMAMWCVADEYPIEIKWLQGLPTDTVNGLKCWRCTIRETYGENAYVHSFRVTACTLDGMYLERNGLLT